MNDSAKKLKIIIEMGSNGIDGLEAFQNISRVMEQLELPHEIIVGGNVVPMNLILASIKKKGDWGAGIETNDLTMMFGHLTALKLTFIQIEELKCGAMRSAEDWVEPFLSLDGFVQAWIADADYDFWQNAQDPLQYVAAGREYFHLPMKSNGLPPPVEQQIIDTTKNPGRWSFCAGYVEAVGPKMWLGPGFWRRVGKVDRERLAAADWLRVVEENDRVLKLQIEGIDFVDESTAEIQDRLRALLFA
jgi:hypothetical protein